MGAAGVVVGSPPAAPLAAALLAAAPLAAAPLAATSMAAPVRSVATDGTVWGEMTAMEQEAARTLGYDEAAWDAGESTASACHPWTHLTTIEQAAATRLGYSQTLWDAELGNGAETEAPLNPTPMPMPPGPHTPAPVPAPAPAPPPASVPAPIVAEMPAPPAAPPASASTAAGDTSVPPAVSSGWAQVARKKGRGAQPPVEIAPTVASPAAAPIGVRDRWATQGAVGARAHARHADLSIVKVGWDEWRLHLSRACPDAPLRCPPLSLRLGYDLRLQS